MHAHPREGGKAGQAAVLGESTHKKHIRCALPRNTQGIARLAHHPATQRQADTEGGTRAPKAWCCACYAMPEDRFMQALRMTEVNGTRSCSRLGAPNIPSLHQILSSLDGDMAAGQRAPRILCGSSRHPASQRAIAEKSTGRLPWPRLQALSPSAPAAQAWQPRGLTHQEEGCTAARAAARPAHLPAHSGTEYRPKSSRQGKEKTG